MDCGNRCIKRKIKFAEVEAIQTFSIENEGACIFGFDLIFAWYFSRGMIPLDKRRASFSLAFRFEFTQEDLKLVNQ